VLPLPPLPEQQAIATFLDRETSRIDSLIGKKKKLVELLAEQRTALISRAVTKGLDAGVKLKPSGVEWLGEVPEHWEVKRLKFIGTALIGLTYSPDEVVDEDYDGEKTIVLRSTNIQDGKISLHENVYVTTRISRELKVRKWDILICARNGSRHLVGKNALINEDDESMTFGAFTTIYRSKINPFLFYYFASNQFKYQSTGFLTTTINQLTNGNLNSIIATLPPLPEQQAIAAFLDRETARIDALVSKVEMAIDKLKEYRTALISAAVTGKIDVREKA
jgi:type I restriction enzyme S subunit